jgi:hypothetical protein
MTGAGWTFFDDARDFLAEAGEFLATDALQHTVLTTVAAREVARREAGAWSVPAFPTWYAVHRHARGDGGRAVASAAMRTAPFAPHPLWLLPMPKEAAADLARTLLERGEAVPGAPFGVNGALEPAYACAEVLAQDLGAPVRSTMHSRLFRLDEVVWPREPEGRLRTATAADLPLVLEWFEMFHAEADEQAGRDPGESVTQMSAEDVAVRIESGRVLLFEDRAGRVVHLTAYNDVSYGTARIGPVLTPRSDRGRGYAGWTVAVVSQRILDSGAVPCLYTDQANPVSNLVYQRIGYTPVVDTVALVVG